ncbi:hypothetical protein KL86SPO_50092 [uncultured Sporomusa sp.]|uniref:NTP pyrophosphohydrolase MazG putative catalytic core domain-containing protein n=1 Tax=uncultured Sporomusa sp. TaxID=307249 RepID=A0A212LXS0_9FIRM|nr:hypothetical protein [uncultured Sporomusa sp.]SCM82321.1 hypothetical protein KL86SPO_50092 [uncultured Sporomusa sp.]
MKDLPILLKNVEDFHRKFGIGINVKSQQEMYARCCLLLEELGELGEIMSGPKQKLEEEIADIAYVLLGNLISMGYKTYNWKSNCTEVNASYENLVLYCGLIAKKIRKEWYPESVIFRNTILNLHLNSFKILGALANQKNFELTQAILKKHTQLLNRKSRIIGNTIVVSHWNNEEYKYNHSKSAHSIRN